jgi:DNA recombination protein RmuC
MTDPLALILAASAALLLATAWGVVAARASRAECARLRAEGAAALAALQAARTEVEVARAEGAARDARLAEAMGELASWRRSHDEARGACAEAESRCAKAGEAVERLEAAALKLREDHAEAVRSLRADHDGTLRAGREEGARVAERLRSVEEEFSRLSAAHARLQAEGTERLASTEREVARLREMREEMTREFQALAAATLRDTGSQFSEAHQRTLQELLAPFREQVGRFETELREVHKHAGLDRAVLTEQIKALSAQAQSVSQDAANLARALKGDKQRQGAWGEAQLERYLELMGHEKGVHYTVQESRTGEEGDRRRPDVILRMPGGKALVIDSKVSLSAYADAVAADTEEEREAFLKLHARNVRARVDELAARDYHHLVDGSVDWVLLFMPVEGAVSAAWAYDPELTAYAMERGIGIAYPSTLQMALRTVKHLWDIERRNENAERIADRAGKLYDKLAGFIENFEMVGRALDSARSAHERARGQLTKGPGNVVRQVEMLKDLGARTGKSLGLAHDAAAGGTEDGEAAEEAPRILGLPEPEGPEPAPGIRPAE